MTTHLNYDFIVGCVCIVYRVHVPFRQNGNKMTCEFMAVILRERRGKQLIPNPDTPVASYKYTNSPPPHKLQFVRGGTDP